MSRERMVTRTIKVTKVSLLTVNVETAESETKTYEISGTFRDKQSILKYVKKNYDTNEVVHVSVTDAQENDFLYGMTEQEFIRNAKVLPPRTVTEAE